MKTKIVTLLVLISVMLFFVGCEPKGSIKQSISLNLTDWSLPDTAKVSTLFDIKLSAQTDNSCITNLDFVIEPYDSTSLMVYAQAIYEDNGEVCNPLVVSKDTAISGSFKKTGSFYFYFLKENVWNKDTIVIIP